MSREKETMEQTATLEKEKENLARELASYINKEKDKVCVMQISLAANQGATYNDTKTIDGLSPD